MKKTFTLLLLVMCFSATYAQPFVTGKRTISFIDASRSNREIATDIYYPANTAGNNVALATGTAKFPVVVFGHGFLIPTSAYKWLADSLIKRGYIVAMPSTEGGIIPNHLDFGLDLSFLCTRITSLNDSSASFLYQRVTKKAAVSGHSMGGGASFLASATLNSAINAVFNFAAAETTPPATLAAYLNVKPTLIFSGTGDCIAKDSIQEVMYNNTVPLIACKTYVDITDALHCQFANNNLICVAGQFAAGCGTSAVSTNAVLGKTITLLVPFLDFYLKGICTAGEAFVSNYNNVTGVSKKHRSCLPYAACGPLPIKLISFTGNLKNEKVNLYWNTASEYNVDHMEIERSSNAVSFMPFYKVAPKGTDAIGASYTAIDAYPFAGLNFYRLKTVDLDGSVSYSDILKFETAKKPLAITQLYPNPVVDFLNIQMQSEKRQTISVSILDLTGKQVQANTISLNAGINDTKISFIHLASGIYILQYKNELGVNSGTFKILKQ